MTATHILTLSCEDKPGIVAAVSTALFDCGGNIRDAQQFDDDETGKFFMRVVFDLPPDSLSGLRERLEPIVAQYDMHLRLRDRSEHKRVLLLVSKFDHCLGDLLYRYRIGELDMDVVGIVSNHPQRALHITMIG